MILVGGVLSVIHELEGIVHEDGAPFRAAVGMDEVHKVKAKAKDIMHAATTTNRKRVLEMMEAQNRSGPDGSTLTRLHNILWQVLLLQLRRLE